MPFEPTQSQPAKTCREQWLENLDLAEYLWRTRVVPGMVSHNLRVWWHEGECGTVACFGGWLATWPEFQALGVKGNDGTPYIRTKDDGLLIGDRVAHRLFGSYMLFEPRSMAYEMGRFRDYDLILHRIALHRARLTAEIANEKARSAVAALAG